MLNLLPNLPTTGNAAGKPAAMPGGAGVANLGASTTQPSATFQSVLEGRWQMMLRQHLSAAAPASETTASTPAGVSDPTALTETQLLPVTELPTAELLPAAALAGEPAAPDVPLPVLAAVSLHTASRQARADATRPQLSSTSLTRSTPSAIQAQAQPTTTVTEGESPELSGDRQPASRVALADLLQSRSPDAARPHIRPQERLAVSDALTERAPANEVSLALTRRTVSRDFGRPETTTTDHKPELLPNSPSHETRTAANAHVSRSTPTEARTPIHRVGEQLVARVENWVSSATGEQQTVMQIWLDPPELGSLRVQLTAAADVISVKLVASTEGASQLLQSQLPELRHALSEAGISFNSLDVAYDQQGSQRPDDGEQPRPYMGRPQVDDVTPSDERGVWQRRSRSTAVIDVLG